MRQKHNAVKSSVSDKQLLFEEARVYGRRYRALTNSGETTRIEERREKRKQQQPRKLQPLNARVRKVRDAIFGPKQLARLDLIGGYRVKTIKQHVSRVTYSERQRRADAVKAAEHEQQQQQLHSELAQALLDRITKEAAAKGIYSRESPPAVYRR